MSWARTYSRARPVQLPGHHPARRTVQRRGDFGTVDDIRIIRELVEKVDVLPPRRIEVVIAEVTISDEASTGIETLGLKVDGDKLVGFSGALAGPSLAVTNGVITRGDAVSGVRDLAAEISIQTTPRKGNTNILSVPAIVTSHNKEARFFVGRFRLVHQQLPRRQQQHGQQLHHRRLPEHGEPEQEIGIELEVKPLIGNDGSVQLDIKQKVEDVLGTITIDNNPSCVSENARRNPSSASAAARSCWADCSATPRARPPTGWARSPSSAICWAAGGGKRAAPTWCSLSVPTC